MAKEKAKTLNIPGKTFKEYRQTLKLFLKTFKE